MSTRGAVVAVGWGGEQNLRRTTNKKQIQVRLLFFFIRFCLFCLKTTLRTTNLCSPHRTQAHLRHTHTPLRVNRTRHSRQRLIHRRSSSRRESSPSRVRQRIGVATTTRHSTELSQHRCVNVISLTVLLDRQTDTEA